MDKIKDRDDAILWVRNLIEMEPANWIVLDTETTGLGDTDQVIEIGIVDSQGLTLMNQRLHASIPVLASATRVHGITESMLENQPTLRDVMPSLEAIIKGKLVIIYNAAYDTRLLEQTAAAFSLTVTPYEPQCAMLQYSAFCGVWDDYHGNYKWQRLPGGREHGALSDARDTVQLIRRMADAKLSTEIEPVRAGDNTEPSGLPAD